MNINDFQRMEKDADFRDRVASAHFYEMGKADNPHFTAVWADVPSLVKEHHAQIGLQVILRTLVDDYTTPGCDCTYCTRDSQETHGRTIMCSQRWLRIPPKERMEIAESVNDL